MTAMAHITCSQCQEALIWYSAGQLPGNERQAIARHLEDCASCRHELEQWQALGEGMRRSRAVLAPGHRAHLWQGIQQRIADQPASSLFSGGHTMEFESDLAPLSVMPQARHIPHSRRPWLPAAASILVVALVAAVFALFTAQGSVLFGQAGSNIHEHPLSRALGALEQVQMLSANDGWAIGWRKVPQDCSTGTTHPSPGAPILHYHDGAWWEVDSPVSNARCASLNSIAMLSANEGWAIGYTTPADPSKEPGCIVLHYDKGSWQDTQVSNCIGIPSILHAFAPDNVWLAGDVAPAHAGDPYGPYPPPGGMMLVMHYDGQAWQRVMDPMLSQVEAQVIWGSGPSDVNIIGHDFKHAGDIVSSNIQLHYDGQRWTSATPFAAGEVITNVATVSPHEAWAVGYLFDPTNSTAHSELAIHEQNGTWGQPTPIADANQFQYLAGISMISSEEGWAVGDQIVHYAHGAWTPVVTSLPSGHQLNSVSMLSATEGWAVGDGASIDGMTIMHAINGTWTTYSLTAPSGATT